MSSPYSIAQTTDENITYIHTQDSPLEKPVRSVL